MTTAKDALNEWHTSIGSEVEVFPHIQVRQLCRRLLDEEASEAKQAVMSTQKNPTYRAKILKELCDVEYIVHYIAWLYGLDVDKGIEAVHESNMTKLIGGIKRDERQWGASKGKILKGDYYQEPDMQKVVDEYDKEREGH